MANFVAEHLGPTLNATHPEIKIFGFDHNKARATAEGGGAGKERRRPHPPEGCDQDHVAEWADGLYKNKTAADYFTGVATALVRRPSDWGLRTPPPLVECVRRGGALVRGAQHGEPAKGTARLAPTKPTLDQISATSRRCRRAGARGGPD